MVKRPVFATVNGPPPVVVTELKNWNAVPVKLIPSGSVVARAPLNVVVPVPAFCVMVPAEIASVETLFAVVIVREVTGVILPMLAAIVIFPVPAV